MVRSIKREEYTYKGRRVILDASELSPGRFEIMLLRRSDGEGIAEAAAKTEADAMEQYNKIRATHTPDSERHDAGSIPLTGKYAKLRDNIRRVAQLGLEAAAQVEDSGTCNMDSAAISLPRWKEVLVEQACKEAGCGCFTWRPFGAKYFVICARIPGQAYKREAAAEAMTKAFQEMGYDAMTYCQMD